MFARRIVIALVVFMLTVPVFAQEATLEAVPGAPAAGSVETVAEPVAGVAESESEDQFVAGAGTPILLLGLAAVLAVGGITMLREQARTRAVGAIPSDITVA
ncbi:MAG: hypothetical protein SGJ24_15540 [Chloroflexota bacterium]|nr:hypothetical protein [Chloroflexota bacterium]